MRLLADVHIAPRTVHFLQSLGHDVLRVDEILPPTAPDTLIVKTANDTERVILTQDLDFSAIIALSGQTKPSLISLRLSSTRVDWVNTILANLLSQLEEITQAGCIVTVVDHTFRVRLLPIS